MMPGTADRFSRLAALRPTRSSKVAAPQLRAPDAEDSLARILGAGIAKNRFGEHISVSNWYSTPEGVEPHSTSLELLARTRDAALTKRTRAALEDSSKWLFLDTETTGLAGGTGTYAFLIGLAWWDAGGLQTEQLIMRDFAEEHSVLHQLAAHLAERPVLLTFNGKTFDWPLLENRFLMTRSMAVPQLAAHLDLLHPARALWKLRLGSVRLVDLERHVLDAPRLGWHRQDDVPSACIPQFYFDYLRGGPVEPLAGVVRHNQMDLRGLAALFAKINTFLATEAAEHQETDGLDLFGLSRFLERRGDSERAHSACAQSLHLGLPAEFRPQARRNLALFAKRRGDHARAAELWQALAADPQDGPFACEQLAIHYERRAKDLARAADFAQLALAHLRGASRRTGDPLTSPLALAERRLEKRLARLAKRRKSSAKARMLSLL